MPHDDRQAFFILFAAFAQSEEFHKGRWVELKLTAARLDLEDLRRVCNGFYILQVTKEHP